MNKFKQLTVIALMLGSCNLFAQKCKPAEKVKDDFTGEVTEYYGAKIGSGKSRLMGISFYVATYLITENGKTKLITKLDYWQGNNDASVNDFKVPKGSVIRYKTSEGLIELTADQVSSQKRKLSDKVITSNEIKSDLSAEQLSLITSGLIEKYQVTPTDKEPITGDVSSSKAQKFKAQVVCFSQAGLTTEPIKKEESQDLSAPIKRPSSGGMIKGANLQQGATYLEGDLSIVFWGLNARIEHFITDKVSIGLSLGATREVDAFSVFKGVNIYEYRTLTTYITPMLRYYVYTKENMGIYAGTSFGFAKSKVKVLSGIFSGASESSGAIAELHAGVKYHLNPKTSFNAELAYGLSLIRLGAAYTI